MEKEINEFIKYFGVLPKSKKELAQFIFFKKGVGNGK
jgi:hypothetical protein